MQTLNSLPENSLQNIQQTFCNYLRNPEGEPIPDGLNSRRINVYRDLVFNNIESLLGNNFPVIKSILESGEHSVPWETLIREFISTYSAKTPLFTELGNEFYGFLQQRTSTYPIPPYLIELAHYEKLEVELFYCELEATTNQPLPNFEQVALQLSPLAKIYQYQFPVHQLSREFTLEDPPKTPTNLLLYRDADDKVTFVLLPEFSFQLLSLIQKYPGFSGRHWMNKFFAHSSSILAAQKTSFIEGGLSMLKNLYEKNVLQPHFVTNTKE